MPLPKPTLERLIAQQKVMDVLVAGLTEEELRFRPIPDKWSAHENIAHLACYQPRVITRTEKILNENNPLFSAYIPDEDPEQHNYVSMNIDKLLSNLKENREKIVKLVSNLTEEQLERTGTHTKFGMMNLVEWTEFFLLHEAHHQHTIFKLIRLVKKSK